MNVENLREKYPNFIYKNFSLRQNGKNLEISFNFQVPPDIEFNPKVVINNVPGDRLEQVPQGVLNNLVFHMGLAEIPSYWKATCSGRIVIEAGKLDNYQISWWSKLLTEGMGQFFWENGIEEVGDFFTIESHGQVFGGGGEVDGQAVLIPVGGGKDSAVTLQLLGKREPQAGVFMLNPISASERISEIAGIKDRVAVERKIDSRLLALNTQGYMNGHTPFSSYLAFLSIFCAYIYGYSKVAFSNERSSDEANVESRGRRINHQYSKTIEFEKDFRSYNEKYLTNVSYFSFLRPLHELQIAKLFSEMHDYFEAFRSCNVGQKRDRWCNHCPKCLSTYILLHPFLKEDQMRKIFSADLFADSSLYSILEQLVRDDCVKPFECVGTRIELRAAMAMSIQMLKKDGAALPVLLKMVFDKGIIDLSMVSVADKLLQDWNGDNFLDGEYKSILRKALALTNT
jgi:hypothetical protein